MLNHPKLFEDDPPAGFDGLFLWDFLKGAFGPTGSPMDFDGVVERRGYFLCFETKAPGVSVLEGQRRTLHELVQDPRWTVIKCAKRPAEIRGWWVLQRDVSQPNRIRQTHYRGDAAALRRWCEAWFQHADNGRL